MQRRQFNTGLSLALAGMTTSTRAAPAPWAQIEHGVAGRLGVAVLDTATGQLQGHRLDERFAMCSTFKWMLASQLLRAVETGDASLSQRLRYARSDLVPYSPATAPHAGGDGLSLAALAEAMVALSDNTAANLVLARLGGVAAFNRHARWLGDAMTRLDRIEPALNEALPGDPRDTTTPRAMCLALQAATLGERHTPASRAQLLQWLLASRTGDTRLRAGVPGSWRVGGKTGAGDRGTSNDVVVMWPPGRAPLVVAAYLTDTTVPRERGFAALAEVGRAVAAQFAAR